MSMSGGFSGQGQSEGQDRTAHAITITIILYLDYYQVDIRRPSSLAYLTYLIWPVICNTISLPEIF